MTVGVGFVSVISQAPQQTLDINFTLMMTE